MNKTNIITMRQIIKYILGLLLNVLLVFPLNAQQDSIMSFSVEEAQNHAQEHNTQMKNARLDVQISDKELWETTARGLPQISASGSYTDNLQLRTQLLPAQIFDPTAAPGEKKEIEFGSQHNASGGISVNQLIFSGPYIIGLQTAKIYKTLSRQKVNKSKQDIKTSIAKTYYLILLAENNKHILSQNIQNLKEMYQESKAMLKNGMINQTQLDKIQININSIQTTLTSTQQQIENNYNMLKIQMGLPLDQKIRLSDSLNQMITEVKISALTQQDFKAENNIQYRLMETRDELAQMKVKKEKADFLPRLSAYYSYQENALRDDFNFFDSNKEWYSTSTLGVKLSFPIFNSGQKISQVNQAKLEVKQLKNSKQELRKNLVNQFNQAQSDLEKSLKKYRTQKDNMQLAKKVYHQTQTEFQEGMATSTEVIQANDKYLQAESQYIKAIVELLNAKTELDKLLNQQEQ